MITHQTHTSDGIEKEIYKLFQSTGIDRGRHWGNSPQESKTDRAFYATRCVSGLLVHPKCKFFWGSAPDPQGSAPQTL